MARTSGTQPTGYVLKIKLTGGTANETTFVKAVNRSTAEYRTLTANHANDAVINLADLSSDGEKSGTVSGFSNGDIIEVRCFGGRMGSGTHTIATGKGGGSVTVTVADVTATNTPGISV